MVRKSRPFLRALHGYVGLTLGAIFTIVSLTGSLAIYQHEIEAALDPTAYTVAPGSELAPIEAVVESALAAMPDRRPFAVFPNDGHPDKAFRLRMRKEGARDRLISVDPYTTEILGERGSWTLVTPFRRIHTSLLLGRPGSKFIGVVSLVMLAMILVGLILWWPAPVAIKRSLTVTWRHGLSRFLRDLHNVAGIYFLIFVIFLTLSGVVSVLPGMTRAAINLFDADYARPPPIESRPAAGKAPISIAQAMRTAQAVVPNYWTKAVWMPRGERGSYRVAFLPSDGAILRPAKWVAVDQYSGEVLRISDAPEEHPVDRYFSGWNGPIHNGAVLGWFGRLLACLSGIAVAILFGSGTYMWYRRVVRR